MGEGCCGGHCGCDHEKEGKHDDCQCGDMSTADLAESNNIIISALIEVLIRKGVLNQQELDKEIDDITAEEEDETPAQEASSAQ